MKKAIHFIFFIFPFLVWLLMIFQDGSLVTIFYKGPENYLILPSQDLWYIFLAFLAVQTGNLILAKIFSSYKIFGKINFVFILFHYFVVFYLLFFNF